MFPLASSIRGLAGSVVSVTAETWTISQQESRNLQILLLVTT